MRDFFRRIRLPALFAGLLLLTVTLMLGDRRALRDGGRDHSWPAGSLLELATRASWYWRFSSSSSAILE